MSEESATPADVILEACSSMRQSLLTIREKLMHLCHTSQGQPIDGYKDLLDLVQQEELKATQAQSELAEYLSHVHIQPRAEPPCSDTSSSQEDLEEQAALARLFNSDTEVVQQRHVLRQLARVFYDASVEFITARPALGYLTFNDMMEYEDLLHRDEQSRLQQFRKFLAKNGFSEKEAVKLTRILKVNRATEEQGFASINEVDITTDLLKDWASKGMLGDVQLAQVDRFLQLVEPFCVSDKPLVKKDAEDVARVIDTGADVGSY